MKNWWDDKVIYQIYPKSFMDSNGDGIGDIPGIISKMDYMKELGVDIVWISPIYESPFIDQGYDISDYRKIAECFGTMEEFELLLEEAKKRDMYIIMDLVINHCSDQHEWFKKALKDPDGRYGKYFYFEKGVNGQPPSNYRSYFGGNMWEEVPGRENLYYLHSFAKQQPDLNWYNQEVLDELYDMVNWWLDKGVAGFRIDAIINIKKNLLFENYEADGPDNLCGVEKIVAGALASKKGPSIGDMLQDLRNNTFKKHDAFTLGEVFNMKEDELKEFIGEDGHFSSIFDFSLHLLTNCEQGWYYAKDVSVKEMKAALIKSQESTKDIGFMTNVVENHDQPRSVDIFIPEWIDKNDGSKLLATSIFLLKGIPCIYQGQELGMTNMDFKRVEDFNDISTLDQYNKGLSLGMTETEAFDMCKKYSRDNARTVMQWDDSAYGGFTTGTPWFWSNQNYKAINAKAQENDPNSVLNYYRKLFALRRNKKYNNIFVYGEFKPIYEDIDDIFAYKRVFCEEEITVISNWGKEAFDIECDKEIILSNKDISSSKNNTNILKIYPGQVVVLH
ncbi:MAG: alpha-glucosidase [Lachnospiraceae bacterium]|nr:alpha-glucosidase [Lachnospiraceae bacterium]